MQGMSGIVAALALCACTEAAGVYAWRGKKGKSAPAAQLLEVHRLGAAPRGRPRQPEARRRRARDLTIQSHCTAQEGTSCVNTR